VQADLPIPQVIVGDTRLGLGRLAASWRRRFSMPLVALTGSNGKTTVKEMVASILATYCGSREAVLATEGNLNNDFGMPLTLLRLRESHRYAVIEMGMNHEGEIDYLTRLAEPGVALVNNAHRAHVGLLGDVARWRAPRARSTRACRRAESRSSTPTTPSPITGRASTRDAACDRSASRPRPTCTRRSMAGRRGS
jgi:UDP-N-acetylmuramyl pentapeptide synthase